MDARPRKLDINDPRTKTFPDSKNLETESILDVNNVLKTTILIFTIVKSYNLSNEQIVDIINNIIYAPDFFDKINYDNMLRISNNYIEHDTKVQLSLLVNLNITGK